MATAIKPRVPRDGVDFRPRTNTYRARWTDRRGNRHERDGFATRELARDYRAAQVGTDNHIGAGDRRTTLDGYLTRWRQERMDDGAWAPSTDRQYRFIQERFVNQGYRLGHLRLVDITHGDVKQALRAMERTGGGPVAANTVRLMRAILVSAFDAAIVDGYIRVNPAREVTTPRIRARKFVVLSPAEVDALMAWVDQPGFGPRDRALYRVAAKTGLRVGEILGLTWADVDLDARTLTVSGQWDQELGRRRGPKSEAGKRTVPLGAATVQALATWRLVQAEERAAGFRRQQARRWTANPETADLVFTGRGGVALDHSNVARHMRGVLAAAGVTASRLDREPEAPAFRFHDFRHTFATNYLLAHPGDVETLAGLLGHSKITTTWNLYVHPDVSTADVAAKVLAAVGD